MRRCRRAKKNNGGLTMVELIVSFVLLSIFVVSATMIIASTMNVYYAARGNAYGKQVTRILINKIAQELEGAVNGDITSEDFVTESGAPANGALIYGGEKIEFINSDGSHVKIEKAAGSGGDYLNIHYFAIPNKVDAGNLYEAVDWTFDKKSYMGYTVKELRFSRPQTGGYAYNVIQIDLTISSLTYGDYSITKYVECYKFEGIVDPSRIIEAIPAE